MDRLKEWDEFTKMVRDHIENYTIPQYGNAPDDQVGAWTANDCMRAVERYTARYGRNARGEVESGSGTSSKWRTMRVLHSGGTGRGRGEGGSFRGLR